MTSYDGMLATPLATEAAGGPPAFLAQLVALLVAAALIGYLSHRLRIVPIVGFLLAGVAIGPNALGLVQEMEVVEAAAEIGVILLLFSIGIEFSLERLARIRRLILLGGGLQVALSIGLTALALAALGVDWRSGIYTGCLVALSSTAIVLKLLADRGQTSSPAGQTSLAFLIFQDLAVVVMVLVVPLIGGGAGGPAELAVALAKAAGIIAVVLVVARRVMPPVLEVVARTCAPELFLLTVIAICFGTAYLTSLAGVSVSLGAFLAGLLVSESRHSEHAFGEILPLQILFSATFFISVGSLLDLGFLVSNLPLVLAGIGLVLGVKAAATGAAALAVRARPGTAVAVSLLLVQVGEFSFVLERVGSGAGLSPAGQGADGSQAFIAATVLLMVATPWLGVLGGSLGSRLDDRSRARASGAMMRSAPAADGGAGRRDHVIVAGYGEAGRALVADLAGAGVPFVITTLNPDGAAEAEAAGHDVLRGDVTKQHILLSAGIGAARMLVIADDDEETGHRIATVARQLNPVATVVVRPHRLGDLAAMAEVGVDKVIDPERASHLQLTKSVLSELRPGPAMDRTVLDPARITRLDVASDACPHVGVISPVLPSSWGCEDCLRTGERWVHLRVCMVCGHAGCCDSSPNRHARAHNADSGHEIVRSGEPGEEWGWCYLDATTLHAAARSLPRPDTRSPAGDRVGAQQE